MDECQKIDLEFEDDGLINDNHFSENSVGFNTNELVGGLNSNVNENEKSSEHQESMEPVRNQKQGRYNLRKSLAWDSAFFTSAGVLDAEELTTMISGADKCEKRLLPRIREELTESTESISSLGSDTLTMETLEDDLFVDIRASIQRSSKRASDLRILNSKTAAMEVDSSDISSLEKEDPVTQIKAIAINEKTPKPGLKKSSSLPSERISKCQPKRNIKKIGSGKAIKQDPVPPQAPVAKTGETKSVKAPKAISRSIPSSTVVGKRESTGTGRARSASGISNPVTISGKGPQPPKVSSLDGPRRGALPKSSLSSSSSLLTSSITSSVHSTRSSTSSDSSSNMSSRINPAKSNLMTPRRNTGKSGDVGTGLIPKTPSRATLKNKVPSSSSSSSSTLSAYMTSNKISSSVSPASSVSEWSSVSSSSSTMVNRKSSNTRTSIDTSSCRSMEGGITHLESRNYLAQQNADGGDKNQGVGLTNSNSKKSSMRTGGILHAPVKPSGLRMPTHKFGFFDGGKLSTRSPNRPQQSPSAVNKGIPKNSSPIRTSNLKQKIAKAPTTRMATSPASIKPSSRNPTLLTSLNPSSPKSSYQESSQQKSHTSADTSIVSKDVLKSPILSVEVKGGSASEEAHQEADKVENRNVVEQLVANTGGAIIEESLGNLKINDALGYDVVVDKSQLVKGFEPTCEVTEKENGYDKSTHQRVIGSTDELVGDASLCRAPFTLKNSFTSDECSDMPKEFVTHVADKSGFLLPESEQKECR